MQIVTKYLSQSLFTILFFAASPSFGGIITVDAVSRTYTGQASTTTGSVTNATTSITPLSAIGTGLGGLTQITAISTTGFVTSQAIGTNASASLLETNNSVSLDFLTGSMATHRSNTPVVFSPSFGDATSRVTFHGTLLPNPEGNEFQFSASRTTVGDDNQGSLIITSNLNGLRFTSDFSSLPTNWTLKVASNEGLTLDVELISHSRQTPGTFQQITFSDTDNQRFSLSVSSVPEPSSLALMSACTLFGIIAYRNTKRLKSK